MEADIFESVHRADRGERSVEECEERLKAFVNRVAQRGLGDQTKLKGDKSRQALETFLELNLLILNVKKVTKILVTPYLIDILDWQFQMANSEAARKILKKYVKRTALPIPNQDLLSNGEVETRPQESSLSLVTSTNRDLVELPRLLVQAITERLLPIIPSIEDYSCVICTEIAFKPIRLVCGHLFCVRCLVKMQKRGNDDCPLCRAKVVLTADRCQCYLIRVQAT
jgi:hypothetical protein